MSIGTMKKGDRIIILASYCGEDNKNCSDDLPCRDCLGMSNIATITDDVGVDVLGGYEYIRGLN